MNNKIKTTYTAYILGIIREAVKGEVEVKNIMWNATGSEATLIDKSDGQFYRLEIKPMTEYLLYLKNHSEGQDYEARVWAIDPIDALEKFKLQNVYLNEYDDEDLKKNIGEDV